MVLIADVSEPSIGSFFMGMKMEPIEGSETSAIRTKTPGNYPKENILHIIYYMGMTAQSLSVQNILSDIAGDNIYSRFVFGS